MILKVNEIFYSLQGETTKTGFPSVFIRLTGCNLKCTYCDTSYARSEGKDITIDGIMHEIKKYKSAEHVTITGGEPLLQKNTIALLHRLIDNNYNVQIETNGSISLKDIPGKVRKIVDIKTPSSGEPDSFIFENIDLMSSMDEVKFVISDIKDYTFSKNFVLKYLLDKRFVINFSPVYKTISYKEIAELILKDQLCVRLNIQLHKIIDLK